MDRKRKSATDASKGIVKVLYSFAECYGLRIERHSLLQCCVV